MRFIKDRNTLNIEPRTLNLTVRCPRLWFLGVRSPGWTFHLWRPAPATGADWLTRVNRSARSRPHCQHSENCPSISSPQPEQTHGFFTGSNGARVFFRIALASANRLSSIIQSSGQHSTGGNSPAPAARSSLRVTQSISCNPKTLLRWAIISGSLAQ